MCHSLNAVSLLQINRHVQMFRSRWNPKVNETKENKERIHPQNYGKHLFRVVMWMHFYVNIKLVQKPHSQLTKSLYTVLLLHSKGERRQQSQNNERNNHQTIIKILWIEPAQPAVVSVSQGMQSHIFPCIQMVQRIQTISPLKQT